jgi:DNA-binding response OmpR family regulator
VPKPFDLLKIFDERPNRALNRDQLMTLAHKKDWDVSEYSSYINAFKETYVSDRLPYLRNMYYETKGKESLIDLPEKYLIKR